MTSAAVPAHHGTGRSDNGPSREEFLTWLVLSVAFVIYKNWIHRTPPTGWFFVVFLAAWLCKIVLQRSGRRLRLPAAVCTPHLVAAAAAAVFVVVYLSVDERPGGASPLGWYAWWDQSQYLLMARDLARFTLDPQHYLYGIGYPLLGSLWIGLTPPDPFLLPNLLMYLATVLLTYRVARVYLSAELSLLSVALLMGGTQFTKFFVIPWNNSVPALCLAFLVALAASERQIGARHAIAAGAALGWVFAARYVDALFLLPVAGYVLLQRTPRDARRIAYPLLAIVAAGAIVSAVLLSHQSAFGAALRTPYSRHLQASGASDQSLAAYRLARVPDHLYSLVVNPYQFHPMPYSMLSVPLLGHSLFFVLSLGGFTYLIGRGRRALPGVLLASLALSAVFYGSFTATDASSLKFHSLRYLLMWYPLLSVAAVVSLAKICRFSVLTRAEQRSLILGGALTLALPLLAFAFLSATAARE